MITQLIDSLNPMQKSAVLYTEGPLLLLAGAGSGKTRVLTHRIAYLIEKCNINPFNILAITFTNKAAKEMKERVEALTEKGEQVWVSTFHSTCVRILRRYIDKLGYSNQFTIYDADDSEKLLKEICKNLNINDKNFPIKMIMSEIGNQKDNLITAEDYAKINASDFRLNKISQVYTEYQKRLKINNALDFDDLIFKTVQLFTSCPDILEKYQDRFKYIMVDEYQDTNTSQYNLIRLLSSKYKNLCVVGDDDQSIYGWRGANIRNILDFEKDFKNANIIKLEQNYRSTQTILNTANEVIKNNISRKSKKLWTENNEGTLIKFYRGNSDLDESAFIAESIEEKVKKGDKYSKFAILYRNNALSRSIEDRLVKSSIPYRLFGGVRFYERREIKDIMSYLKVLYNPADDIALKRIINVPRRGIGDTTILKLVNYAQENGMSFFESLYNLEDIPDLKTRSKKLHDFAMIINDLKIFAESSSVKDLIEKILEDTGYIEELQIEATEEAQGRIDNLQELISKAAEFEEISEDKSLAAFLEEVALVADIDGYSEDDNAVVLMTLHSSKGLEFPYVFITGFEEGIFPSYRSTLDPNPNSIEEERRLCYVGITRAKEELYITCAKSRLQHGQYIANAPSRFYKEIPKNYIEEDISTKQLYIKSGDVLNSDIKVIRNASSTENASRTKYSGENTAKYNSYNKIPAPKNVSIDFSVGDSVKQIRYGIGKVTAINPAGADYEITVEFPEAGTKKFMANLSKLKKVND